MSDTIKFIVIIAFFLFFIYRRKIASFLKDRKARQNGTDTVKRDRKDAPEALKNKALDTEISENNSSEISRSPVRYEVYAIDYSEHLDCAHFSDKLNARLNMIEIEMREKRHYIKYLTFGTLLVILVRYQD